MRRIRIRLDENFKILIQKPDGYHVIIKRKGSSIVFSHESKEESKTGRKLKIVRNRT